MQRLAHSILMLAGGALLCLLIGLVHPVATPAAGGARHRAAGRHDSNPLWRGAKIVGGWLLDFARDHPHGAVAAGMVLVLLVAVPRLIALLPSQVDKDPVRMFTAEQRHAGFARSGGRCEMESIFFTRCRRPAAHGDHWFPHSKGGRTSMQNFVSACVPCNLSKGARTPTAWETTRLEWRRRRYFPEGLDRRPRSR